MQYLLAGIFLAVLALTLLVAGIGMHYIESQRRRAVGGMLEVDRRDTKLRESHVLIESVDTGSRSFASWLSRFDFVKSWQAKLQQAGLNWTVSQLLLSIVIAGLVGALLGLRVRVLFYEGLSVIAMGVLFGTLPYLYVVSKRKKR